VIACTSRTLFGPTDRVPERMRFVGPAVAARPTVEFPWDALGDDRPKVYVSLGSLNAERGARFYGAVSEALADEPVQVVVSAPDAFGPFPPNFVQRPFVPQVELLRRVDAVVTHAGYNTVLESLVNDLPLVCCPIKDDQMTIAQRVADLGAGLRLSFRRPRPAQLRDAVRAVLGEPSYREHAAALGSELRAAGGAWRVADLLEDLARRHASGRARGEEGAA
jgi:MGT family glycosyltransferase